MTASTSHLIPPHGGELINLDRSTRKNCRIEGPFERVAFVGSNRTPALRSGVADHGRLFSAAGLHDARRLRRRLPQHAAGQWDSLADAHHLDVTEEFAKKLTPGTSRVALRDPEGVMLAVLHVEDVWQPDRKAEAQAVFASTSAAHPGADYAINKANPWYVGGKIEATQIPSHYDFRNSAS